MKLSKHCGSRFPLSVRKTLFVAFFTDSIIHLNIFNNILMKPLIEKFVSSRKHVVIMGDFKIDILKCSTSSYSHDFLSSLQSCYLIPAVDKPSSHVRQTSATLIDNIFLNNPDQIVSCGNIISDISNHFSQFSLFRSMKDKIKVKKKVKLRDFSRFSADCFNTEHSGVNWNAPAATGTCDVDTLFSLTNNLTRLWTSMHLWKCFLNEK